MITKQEAYDKTEARIRADGPFAYAEFPNGDKKCVYDPKVNGGCAIGQFLGDKFDPKMDEENMLANQMFDKFPEVAEMFEDSSSPFWNLIQSAHDCAARGHHQEAWGDLAWARKKL